MLPCLFPRPYSRAEVLAWATAAAAIPEPAPGEAGLGVHPNSKNRAARTPHRPSIRLSGPLGSTAFDRCIRHRGGGCKEVARQLAPPPSDVPFPGAAQAISLFLGSRVPALYPARNPDSPEAKDIRNAAGARLRPNGT